MRGSRERLAAATRALKPMQQGSLDGLCGLYSVINAVQLALYPDRKLTRPELAKLFAAGLEVLRKARVLHVVLLHGMHEPLWSKASAAIVARASAFTNEPLTLVRIALPAGTNTFTMIRHVRHNICRGRPVLLRVGGKLDHWTVVARFSQHRLTLFDSSKHAWLLVRSIGVADGGGDHAYVVPKLGLLALHRHRV